MTTMRQTTLDTLGLGTVLNIFKNGALPAETHDLVDRVFGKDSDRGALVISGASGIVGAGKTMQLGSRLASFGVPVVALDVAGAPDGISRHYAGLKRAFGHEKADAIMQNIARLSYDGKQLPSKLKDYSPRLLIEAIPEILELKKAHYAIFRAEFPNIDIRSVTSGFPSSQLGVGVAHPAFPHEINKVWEIVEPEPSATTQLLWALGLIPIPVSDDWSFVLDVLFCGLTQAALRYHEASNMPYWKIDKFVRKFVGPNPFRAHDAIGAKGANFLTWSCLHHLSKEYGSLFAPTDDLVERKDSGLNWYPPNHFRPLVNWKLDADEEETFKTWVLGALFQMTSVMLKENRAHLSHMNIIGELCAQFNPGVLAHLRSLGADRVVGLVEAYHAFHPAAAKKAWHPGVFDRMDEADWQQLYVNAEHDGTTGVITIGRESYNSDVNAELNRAIDWLRSEKIDRVILTGDFHLSTQLVGADTSEFFPALESTDRGFEISHGWSMTARRLYDEFEVSVGFVNGKRCWGGCLELFLHCHYMVSVEDATLSFPEVTLPVVPGMEGCHWPFRRTDEDGQAKVMNLLLGGRPIRASDATGWFIDHAGPLNDAITVAWKIASGADHTYALRKVEAGPIAGVSDLLSHITPTQDSGADAARQAIVDTIRASCEATLADAITIQAKHSAGFMTSSDVKKGAVGSAAAKTLPV